MATRREQEQNRYDRILPFIEEAANQYYGGNLDKGFCHWAFMTIFTVGYDIQDTDVVEATAIDGPDDFEIDGWFIPDSDDDSVVNLFQSKHREPGKTMGANALAPFLNAPERLLNPDEVVHSRNEETKELHDQLKKMLKEDKLPCSINMVWVTSGRLSPQARRHAEANRVRTIPVNIDGNSKEVKVTFKCWDMRDLYQQYVTEQESDDSTTKCDVEFQLDPGSFHQTVAGPWRTVSMTIPVEQIIGVFMRHSYKIFRLNPRGPLGNKTNKNIEQTLLDETERHRFHLLNNGITAICMSWRLEPNNKLAVQDFQIINGCQTTVTLADARAVVRDDPNVLVTVKLTECPEHFAKSIANATNTQSRLKAEDFISTDPIQIKIQREFAAMNPPWFYELKRGEWSRMIGGQAEKTKYRGPSGEYQKLSSREVAQAVVAFAGFPGEAKDKIRYFLEKETLSTIAREGSFSYDRIYTELLSAGQLLLPAVIQRKVWSQVAKDKEQDAWLEYARFSIVWLIAEILREHYRLSNSFLFSAHRAETITLAIDHWFSPVYRVAVAAIRNARQAAESHGEYRGHREFFRAASSYRAMESNVTDALRMAMEFGDPVAGLPS